MNRFSQWDQNVVRERKAHDMRGKGVGLVCHFVKALSGRKFRSWRDRRFTAWSSMVSA
jgi:hypothetical protein